jgi:imidazolonepropionase-like amidohydrolase/Tol biopolymer transport system component
MRIAILAVISLAACGPRLATSAAETDLAITNVNVVDVLDGRVLPGRTVLVSRDVITDVGIREGTLVPAGALQIDAGGRFLMPGLIDTHVHVAWAAGSQALDSVMPTLLAAGVTTARDAGGLGKERELLAYARAVERGEVLGPRLVVSGMVSHPNVARHGVADIAELVRELARIGVHGLKIRRALSEEELRVILREASAAGLPVYGHTYDWHREQDEEYTLLAAQLGAAGVMHISGMPPPGPTRPVAPPAPRSDAESWQDWWLYMATHWLHTDAGVERALIDTLVARGVWIEPTLVTEDWLAFPERYRAAWLALGLPGSYEEFRAYFPAWTGQELEDFQAAYERMKDFLRRFHQAGGLVVAGSDCLPSCDTGIHAELELLVSAGLSPAAALGAATLGAARALGREGSLGAVAPGLLADLLLLDANPLDDIRATRRIAAVIAGGRYLDGAALDRLARPAGQAAEDTVSFTVSTGTRLSFDLAPDGQSLVMDLLGQLWRVPIAGGEAVPLTDAAADGAEDIDPAFSPDGRWILFQGDRPGGRAVWRMPATGGLPEAVTAAVISYRLRAMPAWSPDGSRIAYVDGDSIRIRRLEGGAETALTAAGVTQPAPASPAWSPDGAALAFVAGAWQGQPGGVWEVPATGGSARQFTAPDVRAAAPAWSPDGSSIAFFAEDSVGAWHVWVQPRVGGSARRISDSDDTVPLRLRWTRDGGEVLYTAGGRLWRVPAAGGEPREIPFTATVAFTRPRTVLKPVVFADPGSRLPARGFSGLQISPDGTRFALLALGRLWVMQWDGAADQVSEVPGTAADLSWSPDGRAVVWSTGRKGEEALFVTELASRSTRQLVRIPGGAVFPRWSPDGQHIAFFHFLTPLSDPVLRVAAAGIDNPTDIDQMLELGPVAWTTTGQEPAWSPDSRSLLVYSTDELHHTHARVVPLDGEPTTLATFPRAPTFVHWREGEIVYVESNLLWRAPFLPERGVTGPPKPVSEGAALYASVSRDGEVLHVAKKGLRLVRPGGDGELVGAPLHFDVPSAPEPLLLRNVSIIDGTGAPPVTDRDILILDGRIHAISPAGTRLPADGVREVDGGGRTVIPGLIDLHAHLWDALDVAAFPAMGITTLRDAGSRIARSAAVRDEVNAGLRAGPRIVLGGFFFGTGPGLSGEDMQEQRDSSAIARGLDVAEAFGAEFLKFYGFEEWAAGARLVREAHRRGMRVSGHCTHPLPVAAAGIDGREHIGQCFRDTGVLYDDMIQLTLLTGVAVVPTLTVRRDFVRVTREDSLYFSQPDVAPFTTPYLRALYRQSLSPSEIAQYQRFVERTRSQTERLFAAGVPVGAGTDTPLPHALHWELEALVEAGLTPLQALRAATGAAARILGAEAEIGTIAPGLRADLLLLDGDPTKDIRNTQKIALVLIDGRVAGGRAW